MSIGPATISRFRAVVVAALRVKQLRRGSKPRIEPDEKKHKDTSIAMEEVRRGLIRFTESTPPQVQDVNGMGDLTVSAKASLPVGSSVGDSFTTDEGYERTPHIHPAG
ncbi:MAG TPA: DNA-directed RNA polymerase subunit omega [Pyrinomonadaceae bacterium]|nr:DNA-directed RNA polymerase subunit omega [Pyrinomonadaceae bacterium]